VARALDAPAGAAGEGAVVAGGSAGGALSLPTVEVAADGAAEGVGSGAVDLSRHTLTVPRPEAPRAFVSAGGVDAALEDYKEEQSVFKLWDVRIPAHVVRCVDGAHVWSLALDIADRGFRATSGMVAVTRHAPGDGSVALLDWVRLRCPTESGLDPRSVLRLLMQSCKLLEGGAPSRVDEVFASAAQASTSASSKIVLINGLHRMLALTLLFVFGAPVPDAPDASYDDAGGFLGGRLPAVGRQPTEGQPAPPAPKMPDFSALPASLLSAPGSGGGLAAAVILAVGRQLNVDTGVVARHHSLADELTFAQNFAWTHAVTLRSGEQLVVPKLVELWKGATAAKGGKTGGAFADAGGASASKMEK